MEVVTALISTVEAVAFLALLSFTAVGAVALVVLAFVLLDRDEDEPYDHWGPL